VPLQAVAGVAIFVKHIVHTGAHAWLKEVFTSLLCRQTRAVRIGGIAFLDLIKPDSFPWARSASPIL